MKNNYWEEQDMNALILDFHSKKMVSVGFPSWLLNLKCPFCDKLLPIDAIRSVGFRFNTRNFGDVVVEFMCEECSLMDTLYFRHDSPDISAAIHLMRGSRGPKSAPVVEEKMYKLGYNNIAEEMMTPQTGEHNDSD